MKIGSNGSNTSANWWMPTAIETVRKLAGATVAYVLGAAHG